MENEVLERRALSLECAQGNWIIQIDSDEILMNAPEFKQWIQAAPPELRYSARWFTVFKSFGDQVLMVDPPTELAPIATKLRGQYTTGRVTAQPQALSPLNLLHFSWGRTPEQVLAKLRNWSHANDFDVNAFFDLWQSVNLQNYHSLHNFHPLNGPIWPSLKLATLRFNPWENPAK
jgi:hypothetical protein